jgi:glucose/arabinose dehydrogenase
MFLSYALAGATLRSRLSRFTSSNGGASFDPGSEEVLIEIPQGDPEKIHLNCDMRFGPDGFLWAGFGDGGYGEDSRNEGPEPGHHQRQDPAASTSTGARAAGAYAIPSDNPFVGRAGAARRGLGGRFPQPLAVALRSHPGGRVVGGRAGLGPARGT